MSPWIGHFLMMFVGLAALPAHSATLPSCTRLLEKFAVFSGPMAKLIAAPLITAEVAVAQMTDHDRQALTLIAAASETASNVLRQSLAEQHLFAQDPYKPVIVVRSADEQDQTRSMIHYYERTQARAQAGIPLEFSAPTWLNVPTYTGTAESPFFAEHHPAYANHPPEFQAALNIDRFTVKPLYAFQDDTLFGGYELSMQEDLMTQGSHTNSLLKLAAGLSALNLESPEHNHLRFASKPIPIILERAHPELPSLPVGKILTARYWFFKHSDGRTLDFGISITPIILQN